MSDPLFDLLTARLQGSNNARSTPRSDEAPLAEVSTKYLSRLLSLRLADLTTTEPQSIAQASQSNLLSLQALSSRSHRTTTISSDHLSTLKDSLPHLSDSTKEVRESIPALDESAVSFASTYSRTRDHENASLIARKEAQLLARQADKLQDILELPSLLSAAIASAGSGAAGSANYSQALDLFAHIKRLQILFPDSKLVKSVLAEAETAMKDMTTNLLTSLRSQNIRLAAAIRTIGWLRRVVPELSNPHHQHVQSAGQASSTNNVTHISSKREKKEAAQAEGSFAALFLTARLATFVSMTQALAPLRELADQETERRLQQDSTPPTNTTNTKQVPSGAQARRAGTQPSTPATPSTGSNPFSTGHQTERYLKRYVEIFREQSFSTISMYRNIFPSADKKDAASAPPIPSSLQTFPLHLVEMLMETLRVYMPNITDSAARESLLMQVLYAANSLGRLGADFSMMIALLEQEMATTTTMTSAPVTDQIAEEQPETDKDDQDADKKAEDGTEEEQPAEKSKEEVEPEWLRVIKKHRVQSARLDALAAGQDDSARRISQDVAVR